ncbi:MAG: redoxin domain protein [Isosphaeraceae bacterium]|nr:MAG: redoxin domain protein [Isosphaeraceae bacterium]
MNKRLAVAGLGLVLVALAVRASSQDSLTVGDKAPPLSVAEWVKGDPVQQFEPGKIYVVEFWATWCGPCKVSIPHLTELQKRYKDVTFIGVSVFEDDPAGVEPFVKEMGDKMGYRVALDKVPDGGSANDGAMAKGWMAAAGEQGIPAAFIIDREGRVAWIGHPMSMDQPLERIVAGDWDRNKAAADRKAAKLREQRMGQLFAKLQQAGSPQAAASLLPEVEKLMAEDEEAAAQLWQVKYSILLARDVNEAAAYAGSLLDSPLAENPQILNFLAWTLIDPDANRKLGKDAIAIARRLAQKGCELTDWKEFAVLDTLALAEYLSGDVKAALEHQEKAVELAGDQVQDDMKSRLEKYRKEAGSK